jgi:hypothetical protein
MPEVSESQGRASQSLSFKVVGYVYQSLDIEQGKLGRCVAGADFPFVP